ncbi:hypothetical protein AB0J28_35070, partial [Streptosporangium canum]
MSVDGLSAPPASALPPSLSPASGVPASALPEESGVAREARELVAGLLAAPWGQVSASPYETGRVVSLAPWLTGHAERVGFLLAGQRPDGGWGAPGGYGLVPTLSAVEALLVECRRASPCADPGLLAAAAGRGLAAVRGWELADPGAPLPDMPAIELIVPSLLSLIDGHLDGPGPLRGVSGAKLAAVRTRLASGAAIPQKLVHALEVAGGEAIASSGIVPTPMPGGMAAVGASPGASAAWLAAPSEPAGGAASGPADDVVPRGTGRSSREGMPVRR